MFKYSILNLDQAGVLECSKTKKPLIAQRLLIKGRQRLTLPGFILVPSALTGLTSLFGMGRGDPRRYSHLKILGVFHLKIVVKVSRLGVGALTVHPADEPNIVDT